MVPSGSQAESFCSSVSQTFSLGTTKIIFNFPEEPLSMKTFTGQKEICGLLGYYAASCGNCLPTFRDYVSVPSSRVKRPSRKETPEDRRFDQHRGGNLKSRPERIDNGEPCRHWWGCSVTILNEHRHSTTKCNLKYEVAKKMRENRQ
jgi:hypothetical protein